MNTYKYLIIIIVLFISIQANAQVRLNLTECRKMALENSKRIKIATYSANQATSNRKTLATNYLPNFSVEGSYMHMPEKTNLSLEGGYLPAFKPNPTTGELEPDLMIDPVTMTPVLDPHGNPVFNSYSYFPGMELNLDTKNIYTAGIAVEQPIYMGGKIKASTQMAKIGEEISQTNIRFEQTEVIYSTDEAYWRLVSLNEKKRLASKYDSLLMQLEKKVTDAYNLKIANNHDLLKVRVKRNEVRYELLQVTNGVELSRMALCQLIGLDFNQKIVITDSIAKPDTSILLKGTMTKRPELEMLEKSILLKEKEIKLIQSDFMPQLGVKASYDYLGGLKFNNSEMKYNGLTIAASLKMNIFHWGEGKKKVSVARVEAEKSRLELEQSKELMNLQMAQSRFDVENAYSKITLAQSALIEAAENLKVNHDGYTLGLISLTDLIEAQVSWYKSYSDLIDAKSEAKLKETAFLKAIGNIEFATN